MLKEKQTQDIQDLKLCGYSINEIVRYYEELGQSQRGDVVNIFIDKGATNKRDNNVKKLMNEVWK